jgi:hypothetical protein
VAVGAAYTSFEGYKDAATGETVIGLSYDKLCQYVKPGNLVLMSDGTITVTVGEACCQHRYLLCALLLAPPTCTVWLSLHAPLPARTRLMLRLPQVTEVLNDTELKGRVMSTHKLGQRKNVNLPGVVSDLPVLGPKDIDDVQNFACRWGGGARKGGALLPARLLATGCACASPEPLPLRPTASTGRRPFVPALPPCQTAGTTWTSFSRPSCSARTTCASSARCVLGGGDGRAERNPVTPKSRGSAARNPAYARLRVQAQLTPLMPLTASARQVLAEAGGPHTRVICKIESAAGVLNFDEILAETDGGVGV